METAVCIRLVPGLCQPEVDLGWVGWTFSAVWWVGLDRGLQLAGCKKKVFICYLFGQSSTRWVLMSTGEIKYSLSAAIIIGFYMSVIWNGYTFFIVSFWATATSRPNGLLYAIGTFVYCGQTAGWIKIPLGLEVGLGPGNIVLDGNPAPHWKKYSSPPFSVHFALARSSIWATAELLC